MYLIEIRRARVSITQMATIHEDTPKHKEYNSVFSVFVRHVDEIDKSPFSGMIAAREDRL